MDVAAPTKKKKMLPAFIKILIDGLDGINSLECIVEAEYLSKFGVSIHRPLVS